MFKEIKRICNVLNEKEIPYMLVNGQAVLLYGEPCLTRDIDITLGVDIDRLDDILAIVKQLHLKILPDDIVSFVKETMVLPVLGTNNVRIDFIFSFTEYEHNAIKRAKKVISDDVAIWYASAEDVIIQKIFAGRERDIEDVKIIIAKQKIDDAYIKHWLKGLGK
ncbi:MAG: DUF6036 family nucleotidyltransferase [Spirochaetota bacterium]